MTRRYETVFIMTPVLSEQQTKETVDKFRSYLKEAGAKVVHEDSWGLRKLAYPIQKKSTGFYHLIEFESDGALLTKMELTLKRDERIIRFLTTRMDKHEIEYAEKKRKKGKEAKAQPAQEKEKKEVES